MGVDWGCVETKSGLGLKIRSWVGNGLGLTMELHLLMFQTAWLDLDLEISDCWTGLGRGGGAVAGM